MTTTWTIEPRDTLVLRDGRPMEGTGLQLDSLPMPYPGTVAGFLRTRSASDENGHFRFTGDKHACDALLENAIVGPWLTKTLPTGEVELLLPQPGDAVGFQVENETEKTNLNRIGRSELPLAEGEMTNMPDELEPLFLASPNSAKPQRLPSYWSWPAYLKWLTSPKSCQGEKNMADLGCEVGPIETRTHVRINSPTQTAEDGMLFSLGHRRFNATENGKLSSASDLGLNVLAHFDGIHEGTFPFAGERRLATLKRATTQAPTMPKEIIAGIKKSKRARLILGTPAIFTKGYRPQWILSQGGEMKIHLKAASTAQPISISGWDFLKRAPKPARRAVPAGATYFIEFEGADEDIEAFLQRHWWQTISDDQQDRRDGYGMALFGIDEAITEEGSA